MGRLWTRIQSGPDAEFSELYAAICRGEITPADLPAYQFSGELRNELKGYASMHMQHYQWQDPSVRLRIVA